MSLGVGEHVAYIQERGGATKLLEVPFDSLSYGRKLDEMSDASLTVGAEGLADSRCCTVLAALNAFEHELVIYRDGVEAWVGPLTEPTYTADTVVTPARDLFFWFERRVLPTDRTFNGVDLATIFETYADDALSGDTSPNITLSVTATGVTGDRSVLAAARVRAADEMRELSRSALDFTMVGRELRAGGEELPSPTSLPIIDGLLLDANVTMRGLIAASKVYVVGASDGAGGNYQGSAGGVGADIGLVESVYQEGSILDDASAAASAQSHLDMLAVPPIYVSGQLSPDCSFGFEDLIPGAHMSTFLRIGCLEVAQTLRLLDVRVSASEGAEAITVTLIPLGAQ